MSSEFSKEEIQTDVLVIGGGVGGLMAAIRAREFDKEVTVAEKAHIRRSGCASTGNDHFLCYIPEIHGEIEPVIEEMLGSLSGNLQEEEVVRKFLETSYDVVQVWEDWGIPMKYDGENYEFKGHAMPGRPRIFLKIKGATIKPTLTKETLNRDVNVINRCQIVDLIVDDGQIVGAVGISTREEKLYVFHAKSVILTTGVATRIYPPITPGEEFNRAQAPHDTGAGISMAYRAGAELVNMEFPYTHQGPKFFARCGKASWIGLLKGPDGETLNPYLEEPSRTYGDITADIWPAVFDTMEEEGNAPVYMDCRGISDEDFAYMKKSLKHEGNTALLDYMDRQDIDVQNEDKVEFTRYEMMPFVGGPRIDKNGMTTVDGLFGSGDTIGNYRADLSGAATFGWISGKSAAEFSEDRVFADLDDNPTVEKWRSICSDILSRGVGADWSEVSIMFQQIMKDYVGKVRSESLLEAGLEHVRELREDALESLTADNPHELMHCMEVLNQLDLGEAIILAADERKETRQDHVRADYTYTDPLKDRFLILKLEDGEPKTDWGKRFGLK